MTTEIAKHDAGNGRRSILTKVAAQYSMEPRVFMDTLKATAFREVQTNEQFAALLVVADQYGLNPLTRELYAFPDAKSGGVVPVVGVDGWARIINHHPQFDGMDYVWSETMVTPAGGKPCPEWCECQIYRKDRSRPTVAREYVDECFRKTTPWQTHTKRMLRHKATIQAARLAFGFAGIFDPDEAERFNDEAVIDVERPRAAADRVASRLGIEAAPTAETAVEAPPPAMAGETADDASQRDSGAAVQQDAQIPPEDVDDMAWLDEPIAVDENGEIVDAAPKPVTDWQTTRLRNLGWSDDAIAALDYETAKQYIADKRSPADVARAAMTDDQAGLPL